jgi:hemerythrin superfamily protein
MDAIEVVRAHYGRIGRRLASLAAARTAAQRRGHRRRLAVLVATHAALEEHLLYPLGSGTGDELLDGFVEDHLVINELLATLLALDPTDEQFALTLLMLAGQLEAHMEAEEELLFEWLRLRAGERRLVALGDEALRLAHRMEHGRTPRFGVAPAGPGERRAVMNAIELLEDQHREVESYFDDLAHAENAKEKDMLFRDLADAIAVHTEIEERIFYPQVQGEETEEILRASAQEHGTVKRMLLELLEATSFDDSFDERLEALREEIEHHVAEEEGELFPIVRRLYDADRLDDLGAELEAMASELQQGEPREQLPGAPEEAAVPLA